MASIKFALLVAFLVVFIGHGLVSDAKPIEKKEGGEEKDAPAAAVAAPKEEEAEADNDDDEGDAEEDSTRSKVQKHKSATKKCKKAHKGVGKNCKRELRIHGAIRPFGNTPAYHNQDKNEDGESEDSNSEDRSPDDDDQDTGIMAEDGGPSEDLNGVFSHTGKGHVHETSNIDEQDDENKIEQDIINAEGEQRDSKPDKGEADDAAAAATDAATAAAANAAASTGDPATAYAATAAAAAATPSADEHNDGEMRDINGGNYDHHSSNCPYEHDQIMQVSHGGHQGFHGSVGGFGGGGFGGGFGGGCGCIHGAIGPSGTSVGCGCEPAGQLATYVCNATQTPCCPNMNCANICGNINMGLPHPECQQSTAQDKQKAEALKDYCPSCKLVNINGNVGLSLPHPCLQLSDQQKSKQNLVSACGSNCGQCGGCCSCGCGCGCGCGGGGGLSGFGRDSVVQQDHTVVAVAVPLAPAAGDGSPAENTTADATPAATPAASPPAAPASGDGAPAEVKAGEAESKGEGQGGEDKHPAKRFDHHSDEDVIRVAKRTLGSTVTRSCCHCCHDDHCGDHCCHHCCHDDHCGDHCCHHDHDDHCCHDDHCGDHCCHHDHDHHCCHDDHCGDHCCHHDHDHHCCHDDHCGDHCCHHDHDHHCCHDDHCGDHCCHDHDCCHDDHCGHHDHHDHHCCHDDHHCCHEDAYKRTSIPIRANPSVFK